LSLNRCREIEHHLTGAAQPAMAAAADAAADADAAAEVGEAPTSSTIRPSRVNERTFRIVPLIGPGVELPERACHAMPFHAMLL
jgi:hypothetical protein